MNNTCIFALLDSHVVYRLAAGSSAPCQLLVGFPLRSLLRRERSSLRASAKVTSWLDVAENLKDDYGGLIHRVPKLEKISVARSMGVQAKVEKLMNNSMTNLARITGVKPQAIIAKRSIALKVQRAGTPKG